MRALRTAAAVLLGAVVLAGCGSDGGGDSDGPGGRPPSGGSGTAASAPAQPSPGPSSDGTAAPSGKPTDTAGAPTAPSVPVSPGPSSALERLVTVTRSGGIAGRTSSLLVKGDGSWTRLDAQARPAGTGKLAPDRVAKLRAALGQADFAHLPRVLKGGGTVFDGFFYAFVHGGHEVAADQESLTPHLQDVLDELPPFEAG